MPINPLSQIATPCFSPGGDCENLLIDLISNAQSEIYLAMFYLTNDSLVNAMVEAKERGVEVYAVFDASQKKSFAYLQHGVHLRMQNIPVKYAGTSGKMHSKFVVIDGKTLVTGSYNWTESAEHKNTEDFLVIHSEELAHQYANQFVKIWDEGEIPN